MDRALTYGRPMIACVRRPFDDINTQGAVPAVFADREVYRTLRFRENGLPHVGLAMVAISLQTAAIHSASRLR